MLTTFDNLPQSLVTLLAQLIQKIAIHIHPEKILCYGYRTSTYLDWSCFKDGNGYRETVKASFDVLVISSDSGNIIVIQPKDIDPVTNVLNVESALRIADFSGDNKYILKPGDILLGNKGKNTPVIVINNPRTDMVASSAFTVIRPMKEKGIDPNYLGWYLQLPVTQKYFQSTKVGSTVLNLLTKSVQETEIHLPPLAEQYKIGNIYNSLVEQNAKQITLINKYFQLVNEELYEKIKE